MRILKNSREFSGFLEKPRESSRNPETAQDTVGRKIATGVQELTAFNGQTIVYDEIGNPTNDGTWNYTWAKGRQLQSMSKDGETVNFVYNEDGLRVQKTATSTGTTKYTPCTARTSCA